MIRKIADSYWQKDLKYLELTNEAIERIRKNCNQNWDWICSNYNLSEPFMREFEKHLNWRYVSFRRGLSESFIRDFHDRFNWYYISYYQELSEDFILDFYDRVDWKVLNKRYKIKETLKKMNGEQKLYMVMNYREVWVGSQK